MDISVIPSPPGSRFPYKLEIKGPYTVLPLRPFLNFLLADKHVLSEDEKKTQEYATHNLGPIVSANITDYKIRQISIPLRVIRGHSLSCRVHNLLAALWDPSRMVQLRHLHTDVVRVHVWICESFLRSMSALSMSFYNRRNSYLSWLLTTSWRLVTCSSLRSPPIMFLQSVAHMPMKAMVYKTLSTVVDDFFA